MGSSNLNFHLKWFSLYLTKIYCIPDSAHVFMWIKCIDEYQDTDTVSFLIVSNICLFISNTTQMV